MNLYGLIGYPLGHSFSATYFNERFAREGLDARYELFPLTKIEQLPALIDKHPELCGLNVTIPYKQAVIPYLNSLDSNARDIGAVNVIRIVREGNGSYQLSGHNSDATGFADTLGPLLRSDDKCALVLGTGGAAKAVLHVLKGFGFTSTIVSRTPGPGHITYNDLNADILRENTVIVNTTPVGMFPNVDEAPALPYALLTARHLCYDVVYNPTVTEFMRRAQEHGAAVKNGLDMLHRQAEVAWQIWNE